jgi:hypothetical protein
MPTLWCAREHRWSRDGATLAWASQWLGVRPVSPLAEELQHLRLTIRPSDGGARRLNSGLAYINDFDWAADDRSLIAAGGDRTGRTGLFRIDVETGATTVVALTPGEQVDLPRFAAPLNEGRTPAGNVTEDHLYYRRIRIAGQTSRLVEHDLRTGAEREVLPWAGRCWRGRPDERPMRAVDVLTITPDRRVLSLASAPARDVVTLNALSIGDEEERELMRTAAADRLVLLGVTADAHAALVRRDVAGADRSETWLVAIDGAREPERLDMPDLSGFTPIGWSPDRSRLLLERRLSDDKSELTALTPSGEFTRLTMDHELFWTAVSSDGRQLAYGTGFRAPAAPLAVWVLEHAIEGVR